MNDTKKLFPVFDKDNELVYLDSAASAQKPRAVLEVMRDFASFDYANVHRGLYPMAQRADAAYNKARVRAAAFLGAAADEIVWVRGASEGINLVAASMGADDKVIASEAEHHSNLLPWQKCKLEIMPVDKRGRFDLDWLKANVAGAKMVAITAQSNVLGAVTDVAAAAEIAHGAGALVLADAAQYAAHSLCRPREMGADFLVFSAHKLYGPTGLGVLYGRRELLEKLPPYQLGGDMLESATYHGFKALPPPQRFEAGTQNIMAAVGLAAALDFMDGIGMEKIAARARELTLMAVEKLSATPRVRIISSPDSSGIVSFVVEDASPYDVAALLGARGVCVRAGHHCAEPLHGKLGIGGSIRASIGAYNDESDIERFADELARVLETLK